MLIKAPMGHLYSRVSRLMGRTSKMNLDFLLLKPVIVFVGLPTLLKSVVKAFTIVSHCRSFLDIYIPLTLEGVGVFLDNSLGGFLSYLL